MAASRKKEGRERRGKKGKEGEERGREDEEQTLSESVQC